MHMFNIYVIFNKLAIQETWSNPCICLIFTYKALQKVIIVLQNNKTLKQEPMSNPNIIIVIITNAKAQVILLVYQYTSRS